MTASRPLRASADSAFGVTQLGEGALSNAAVKSQPGLIAGALAAAIGTGWLVAEGDTKVVALVLATALVVVLAARAPGALAGLLLLATMNGLPIIDLSGRLPGGLHIQDGAVFALGVLLFAYGDRTHTAERARLIRVAAIWSGCFIAWWTFTLARSVLLDGIPAVKAVLYCRDFLYFALLLPLALRARFPPSSLRTGAWLLSAGAAAYAIGAIIVSLTGIGLLWLIHPAIADPTLGVTRLYASMSILVNTFLIFAAAVLLSQHGRRKRLPLAALTLLLAVTALLQLGRANYFALGVAGIAGVWVYVVRYGPVTPVVVRGIVLLLLGIVVALAFTGAGGSTSATATPLVGTVISRVETGVSDLSGSTGTVGYRETVDTNMLKVLGASWPVGLGFLYPADHYVPTLPSGSIRNTDTGVFNIVMTMGIVGALLLYAPLAYGVRELMRASKVFRRERRAIAPWIIYGGVAWIAWVFAGSPTGGVLFDIPGLVLAGIGLGFLGQAITPPALGSVASDQRGTRQTGPG